MEISINQGLENRDCLGDLDWSSRRQPLFPLQVSLTSLFCHWDVHKWGFLYSWLSPRVFLKNNTNPSLNMFWQNFHKLHLDSTLPEYKVLYLSQPKNPTVHLWAVIRLQLKLLLQIIKSLHNVSDSIKHHFIFLTESRGGSQHENRDRTSVKSRASDHSTWWPKLMCHSLTLSNCVSHTSRLSADRSF